MNCCIGAPPGVGPPWPTDGERVRPPIKVDKRTTKAPDLAGRGPVVDVRRQRDWTGGVPNGRRTWTRLPRQRNRAVARSCEHLPCRSLALRDDAKGSPAGRIHRAKANCPDEPRPALAKIACPRLADMACGLPPRSGVRWHRLGRPDGYDFNGQISWSASATGSGTR